ncbi:plasmid transfer protein [Mucilaginibacter corticis]|uniref:Plasmid transfer protein n=1 Tax=Mucilaginibacter corticis TaxID=2597670 RepID=A0A556MM16_9SPHI|nr:plasmid transfer protein [Mucilaginibacter corticis]TSJ40950.1 plasmid transfer protein [Mucilaginibacter corticis]
MARTYPIYKGLQKPLVYRGFKGKFIYWGIGALLAGLVFGGLTITLVNIWLGTLVLISCIAGGLVFVASRQKQGLHSKAGGSAILIHPSNLKKLHRHGQTKL